MRPTRNALVSYIRNKRLAKTKDVNYSNHKHDNSSVYKVGLVFKILNKAKLKFELSSETFSYASFRVI